MADATSSAATSKPEQPVLQPPLIVMIAGEASGDQLGAALIRAIRLRHPHVRVAGIGGPRMVDQGLELWHDMQALSIMGFAEVVRHLPGLLALRRHLFQRIKIARPVVFIGIDAPDFNLGLERRLKQTGIATVHYVSPSVWAWREKRAATIGRSVDRILCLFPMEPPIYARHHVDARFVGHPLAARFPLEPQRNAMRSALGVNDNAQLLAVMPGSRSNELQRLAEPFIHAATSACRALPDLRILIPAADHRCRERVEAVVDAIDDTNVRARFTVLDGRAHDVLQAVDAVLIASGTATLEAMLAKCPMVVGYRVSPASYRLAKALRMLKTDIFALPNILARFKYPDMALPAPELMQNDCTADKLATEIITMLTDAPRRELIRATFMRLHHALLADHTGKDPATMAATQLDDLITGSEDVHDVR